MSARVSEWDFLCTLLVVFVKYEEVMIVLYE